MVYYISTPVLVAGIAAAAAIASAAAGPVIVAEEAHEVRRLDNFDTKAFEEIASMLRVGLESRDFEAATRPQANDGGVKVVNNDFDDANMKHALEELSERFADSPKQQLEARLNPTNQCVIC